MVERADQLGDEGRMLAWGFRIMQRVRVDQLAAQRRRDEETGGPLVRLDDLWS